MLNQEYILLKAKRIEIIQRVMLSGFKDYELDVVEGKIEELQKQCKHKFENGHCIYCEKEGR